MAAATIERPTIDLNILSETLKQPTWYQNVVPWLQELNNDPEANGNEIRSIYDIFEQKLLEGGVALGVSGKKWDADRKPIDTVVIHHTAGKPGMRLSYLSAVELLRLYAPAYFDHGGADADIAGQPICSGHFREGRQIFWPYHWLVRSDGTCERLLEDHEIGWHSGKWSVNCRSLAICFDKDLTGSRPSEVMLTTVAKIIRDARKQYPQISLENIIGHREVSSKTTCPSELFLTTRIQKGWKGDLLAKVI